MKIGIVSCTAWCGKVGEDLELQAALTACGCEAAVVPWEQDGVDWAGFDAAVLRSAWGYQHRVREFFAWMDMLVQNGVRLLNPPEMLRENICKHRQMLRWRRAGLPLIPTAFLSRRTGPELCLPKASLLATIGEHFPQLRCGFVIKPVISASGSNTVLLDPYELLERSTCPMTEAETLFQTLLGREDSVGVMLQPFYPEIAAGELALVYFGGKFSHAARRFTGVLGGKKTAVWEADVSVQLLEIGEQVLAALGEIPAYMRVDVIETQRGPVLMEVELAEPFLFLNCLPEREEAAAVQRFAKTILAQM